MILESKFRDQNDMSCDKFLLDQLTFNGFNDGRTKTIWLSNVRDQSERF